MTSILHPWRVRRNFAQFKRLEEVCPEYRNALDVFGQDPTEENWAKAQQAARAYREAHGW